MRPSRDKGNIGVLDTRAECLVVKDALQDKNFLKWVPLPPSLFGMRFMNQTHDMNDDFGLIDINAPKMNTDPRLEVTSLDHSFVVMAATRIMSMDRITDRLRNKITGRTKAAKSIIKFCVSGRGTNPLVSRITDRYADSGTITQPKSRIKARDTNRGNDSYCTENIYDIDGEEMLIATRYAEIVSGGGSSEEKVRCYGAQAGAGCGKKCVRRQLYLRITDMERYDTDKPHTLEVLRGLKLIEKGGILPTQNSTEQPVRVRSRRTF